AAAAVEYHRQPMITQLLGRHERKMLRQSTLMHQIYIVRIMRNLSLSGLHQLQHTLDAKREAARRRRLAADLLEQSIVAAARAQCSLRAEAAGSPFKYRIVVIIEPAHQPRIHRKLDTRLAQQRLH